MFFGCVFHVVFGILLLVCSGSITSVGELGKRELFFMLSFTCNYVFSDRKGFFFLLVLRMGCVILLWHSFGLTYDYFATPFRYR